MREKKIIYSIIFLAIMMLLNLYYIWNTERRFYATQQCGYQLVSIALSTRDQVRKELKEIKSFIANFENAKILELSGENLELKSQNEKLIKELLDMFSSLKGGEMPLNESFGKTNI